jgi:1-acyl-sn-glycerol-3-phosphate acyltransferase
MLHTLPAPMLGAIMLGLLVLNTLFWVVPLYGVFVLKLLTPAKSRARSALSRLASDIAQTWAAINSWFVENLLDIEWDMRIHADFHPDGQYLVCSNHQTWNDIVVLMKTFGRRAPFFKFFLKQELIWVPFLGLAWWGLDYPFMKRYTKEQIAKNPERAGKDLETTRIACERFRDQPVLILNFLEGTRFTRAKQAAQKSPYKHLLRPKSGGFAFTMGAMGERLNSLLDVTIAYPDGPKGQWDFLAGRVRKVIVDVRQLIIPHELYEGSYETDADFRRRFHQWIAELWAEKDRRLEAMLTAARV